MGDSTVKLNMNLKSTLIAFALLFISGCVPFTPRNTFTVDQPDMAATDSPVAAQPTSIIPSVDPSPDTARTGEENQLKFDDQSGISMLPELFSSDCEKITFTETLDALPGDLVVYDHESQEPLIWDFGESLDSLEKISYSSSTDIRPLAWDLSPTHDWLSYENVKRMDDFTLNVYNPRTDRILQTAFQDYSMAGYPSSYWSDADHYIVPLSRKEESFGWVVWQPFKDEQSLLELELPDMGDAPDQYSIFPQYLPNSKIVIYPCNQCGTNEFQAYDLESNKVKWTLDFGEGRETGLHWSFIPSPDGKKIVFFFGLNKLWIVDTNGESLLKISLPFSKSDNWVVEAIRWSPDGKKLAFMRYTPDGSDPILTIISIHEHQQTSYCSNLGVGNIHWSFDGQYIVHSMQEQNDDGEVTSSIFSVVQLNTGKTYQKRFHRNLSVIGWLK